MTLSWIFGLGARRLSYVLGGAVVLAAAASAATGLSLSRLAGSLLEQFGISFLVLYGGLLAGTLVCWLRMGEASSGERPHPVWLEAAPHGANGIATLALTYTLLGISLGIGSLSGQPLNPDTVQGIIRSLTEHFSLAFMTTVVGLPTAAVLRALIAVTAARQTAFSSSTPSPGGDT